jgi:hypothetical protein
LFPKCFWLPFLSTSWKQPASTCMMHLLQTDTRFADSLEICKTCMDHGIICCASGGFFIIHALDAVPVWGLVSTGMCQVMLMVDG